MSDQDTVNIAVVIERLDNLKENMERRTDEILGHVQKTNGRVTALEIALAVIKGKAVVWGSVAGAAISLVGPFVLKKFL